MDLILDIFVQGLIYGILVLGVYLTYKILDMADLSVDGSFPLGAAITASAIVNGINPFLACILSLIGGMAAGAATGFLHVKLKISILLSGILVQLGLYSINLRIMGKSNVPLFSEGNVFSGRTPVLIVVIIFAVVVKLLVDLFLKTKSGYILIAAGDNPQLVTSLGIDIGIVKIAGLMLSNGLVALSGSLMAQYLRFSDANMGVGTIVIGLASIIIGEAIFRKIPLIAPTTMIIGGAILYKAATALALNLRFSATDLKLITSLIVIIALALNQSKFNFKKRLSVGGDSAAADSKSIQDF